MFSSNRNENSNEQQQTKLGYSMIEMQHYIKMIFKEKENQFWGANKKFKKRRNGTCN